VNALTSGSRRRNIEALRTSTYLLPHHLQLGLQVFFLLRILLLLLKGSEYVTESSPPLFRDPTAALDQRRRPCTVWPGWGPATVFPQAVGLGATWNDGLLRRVGDAVAQETRAMRARNDRAGLNVWAPTVSLLRHPLRGRNGEGYAEDPHLTAAIATAYTRGLRGDDPSYCMTAPVLKRWPAHSNETDRSTSSSSARPRVLHEYDMRASTTCAPSAAPSRPAPWPG
jgi:hypothetical protein